MAKKTTKKPAQGYYYHLLPEGYRRETDLSRAELNRARNHPLHSIATDVLGCKFIIEGSRGKINILIPSTILTYPEIGDGYFKAFDNPKHPDVDEREPGQWCVINQRGNPVLFFVTQARDITEHTRERALICMTRAIPDTDPNVLEDRERVNTLIQDLSGLKDTKKIIAALDGLQALDPNTKVRLERRNSLEEIPYLITRKDKNPRRER